MSRSPAIADEHAPREAQQPASAKHIRRADDPCRMQAAGRFSAAVEAAGASLARVARAWGVGETTVRDVASCVKPLTGERIEALPPSVKRAYGQSLIDDVDEQAPPSGLSAERHAVAIGSAYGALMRVLHEALADNLLSDDERRALVRCVHAEIATLRAFERELERGLGATP